MKKSITTYYCDRCGERMKGHPIFWCFTHPYTAIQILFKDGVGYADLCDKCKESFKAWWEMGKSSASLTETESEGKE